MTHAELMLWCLQKANEWARVLALLGASDMDAPCNTTSGLPTGELSVPMGLPLAVQANNGQAQGRPQLFLVGLWHRESELILCLFGYFLQSKSF